jgi:tape measure domain-containing protein
MADDMSKLMVLIEANTKAYENAMKKVIASTDGATKKGERAFKKLDDQMRRVDKSAMDATRALVRMAGPLAALASAGGFIKLADSANRMENALKVAGLAGTELARVQEKLFEAAQKNAAPLEDLTNLFGKVSQVQKELGVSTDELLGFTENIAVALRVSGKSATEAQGALLQLSQALAAGTVRAEEYQSVNEGAPTILRAVAVGLKEAEGSLGKLRNLVIDGKVSSEAFFRAFEAGAYVLKDQVANSTFTVGQQMTRLYNALTKVVGEIDSATNATGALTGGIEGLSAWLEELAGWIDHNRDKIMGWSDAIWDTFATIEKWKNQMRDAIGIAALLDKTIGTVGDGPIWDSGPSRRQDKINRGGKGGRVTAGYNQQRISAAFGMSADGTTGGTVSLGDFAAAGKGAGKGGAGAKKESVWKDFGFSEDTINSAETMALQLDAIADKNAALKQSFASLAGGIVNGMMQGKTAAERLANVLDNVVGQLLDTGINALISGLTGGIGRGSAGVDPWAGLRSLPGRATGGPVSKNKPYMVGERGPEMFVPSTAGSIKANGTGAANVQVFNNYAGQASVSTEGSGSAGDPLRIVIEAVKNDMAKNGIGAGAEGRYGLRRQTRAR